MGASHDTVDKSYENLLNQLPEEVAEKVREKYEKDAEDFIKAAKAACPSQAPSYWAKSSCRKCYGRGTLGTKHVFSPSNPATVTDGKYENSVFTLPIKCTCADKNYEKWLKEFRKFYNARKEQDEGISNEK